MSCIVFDKLARGLVHHILLPVPTATTKGVLVAPTVFGNVLLGPTAEDLEDRTDTVLDRGRASTACWRTGRRILPALLDHEVTAVYAGLRAATEHTDYRIRAHAEQRYVCRRRHPLDRPDRLAGHRRARPRPARRRSAWTTSSPSGRGARDPTADADAGRGLHPAPRRRRRHRRRPRVRAGRLPLRAGDRRRAARRRRPPRCPATDLDGLRRRTRAGTGAASSSSAPAASRSRSASAQPPPRPRSVRRPPATARRRGRRRRARRAWRWLRPWPDGVPRSSSLDGRPTPGGIPRHSHHRSFGLDLHRLLRGPEYARRRVERALAAGPTIRVRRQRHRLAGGRSLAFTASDRAGTIAARAVVLATGCRERPRSARLVPGDRPAGVMTTGQLQQLVAAGAPDRAAGRGRRGRARQLLGRPHPAGRRRPGRDDHARRRATTPSPPSPWACGPCGCRCDRNTEVTRIIGRTRVEAVELADGSPPRVRHRRLHRRLGPRRRAGPGTAASISAQTATTSRPGVFAVGNLRLLGKRADQCVRDAQAAADAVTAWL